MTITRWAVLFGLASVFVAPLIANSMPGSFVSDPQAPIKFSPTNPVCTTAACDLVEGNLIFLPFIAIAGDVILQDPDGSTSDVVRFFNDLVDTGSGTGLSDEVFVYSKIDSGADLSFGPDVGLPNPSTYSANAITIPEAPDGFPTVYNGNGTLYDIWSDSPEVSSVVLLSGALLMLTPLLRKRRTQ